MAAYKQVCSANLHLHLRLVMHHKYDADFSQTPLHQFESDKGENLKNNLDAPMAV